MTGLNESVVEEAALTTLGERFKGPWSISQRRVERTDLSPSRKNENPSTGAVSQTFLPETPRQRLSLVF